MTARPLPESSESISLALHAVRAELEGLKLAERQFPLAVELLTAREGVLRNYLHDLGLDLAMLSGPWLSWMRVPEAEVVRLGLEELVSDSSFRTETHYLLDAADTKLYRSYRQAEGSGELVMALGVPVDIAAAGIWRMDDYRARGWTSNVA